MSWIPSSWQTSMQIAERWACTTAVRVGAVACHLGLWNSEKHACVDGDDVYYSPDAVGLIERELRSRGYRRADEEST